MEQEFPQDQISPVPLSSHRLEVLQNLPLELYRELKLQSRSHRPLISK